MIAFIRLISTIINAITAEWDNRQSKGNTYTSEKKVLSARSRSFESKWEQARVNANASKYKVPEVNVMSPSGNRLESMQM